VIWERVQYGHACDHGDGGDDGAGAGAGVDETSVGVAAG